MDRLGDGGAGCLDLLDGVPLDILQMPVVPQVMAVSSSGWEAVAVPAHAEAVTLMHHGEMVVSLKLGSPIRRCEFAPNGLHLVVCASKGLYGWNMIKHELDSLLETAKEERFSWQLSSSWLIVYQRAQLTVFPLEQEWYDCPLEALDDHCDVASVWLSPRDQWALVVTAQRHGWVLQLTQDGVAVVGSIAQITADYVFDIVWFEEGQQRVLVCGALEACLRELPSGRALRYFYNDQAGHLSPRQLIDPRGDPTLKGLGLRGHRRNFTPRLQWLSEHALLTSTQDGTVFHWDPHNGDVVVQPCRVSATWRPIHVEASASWAVILSRHQNDIQQHLLQVWHTGAEEAVLQQQMTLDEPRATLLLEHVVILAFSQLVVVVSLETLRCVKRMQLAGAYVVECVSLYGDWWALRSSQYDTLCIFCGAEKRHDICLERGTYTEALCGVASEQRLLLVSHSCPRPPRVECWCVEQGHRLWIRDIESPDPNAHWKLFVTDQGAVLAQLLFRHRKLYLHALDTPEAAAPIVVNIPQHKDPGDPVVTVSPCGTLVAYVCESTSTVRVADLQGARRFLPLTELRWKADAAVASMAFSCQRHLALAYDDGLVQLLDERDWDPRGTKRRRECTCPDCGKILADRRSCERHQRSCRQWSPRTRRARRTGVRPTQCRYCGETKDPNSLKRHEMYSCPQRPR